MPDSIRHSAPGRLTAPGVGPDFKTHRGRWARAVGFLVALLIAALAAGVLWIRYLAHHPVEHPSAGKVITIDQGTSTNAIIERLAEARILHHPRMFKLYLRLTGGGGALKAGDYTFPTPISPLQAIEKIRRGEVALERVTIPEGFNRFEISELLAAKTGKATAEQFLKLTEDQTYIERIAPTNRDLEGYLFPDTYNYSSKTSAEDLIRAMVGRFDEVFTPEWTARASQLGMTVNQIVTLASIIEKEAHEDDERATIASVFYNRLKIHMPLASDPTFIYAAKLAGDYDGNPNRPRHRTRVSAYNTYLVSGLPPAPIASPGRASLEAALYPAKSDYLYFVAIANTGRHKFSRTAVEHELAVADYRRYQRESRQNGSR